MSESNFKFLIVGAGRGGTSLLAGLLDYHPELEVGFEYYSAACLMGTGFLYMGPDLFHHRVTAFVTACCQIANQFPNSLWGNKITTEQIYGLQEHNRVNPLSKIDILSEFFSDYLRDIKIVFILRDGRTCVNSKVQRTGQSMEKACERWKFSVKCYNFFCNNHFNNICIRYEDLLLNPQITLTKVCNFLSISYQPEMLDGIQNKKMLPEYRNHKIDLSKMTHTELPEKYFNLIIEDLKYCGYI